MKVLKWGDSLAIRLSSSVVEALELQEGDDIEVIVADSRVLEIQKKTSRKESLDQLKQYRGRIPADFKFDQEESNPRCTINKSTELDLEIKLAIKLFKLQVVTLNQAAKLAKMSVESFLEELSLLGITVVDQTVDELNEDLEKIQNIGDLKGLVNAESRSISVEQMNQGVKDNVGTLNSDTKKED